MTRIKPPHEDSFACRREVITHMSLCRRIMYGMLVRIYVYNVRGFSMS